MTLAKTLICTRNTRAEIKRTVGLRYFRRPDVAAHFHFLKNSFAIMVSATSFFNNWRSHGKQRQSRQPPRAQGDGIAHAGRVRQAAIEHDRTTEWSEHEARSRATHRLLRQRDDVQH